MSIESELARALGHIYEPGRAGTLVRITLGNTTKEVQAVIASTLLGGDGGGFTTRYGQQLDGIAARWLVSFQKPDVADLVLSGCRLVVVATGQRYELHEPLDEQGQGSGEITYGASTA